MISTSIELNGEKEFKRQLSDVNSNLKTLNSEMKLTTEEFKGQANSVDALEAKNRVLNSQIEQQTEKARALENALEQVGEIYQDQPRKIDEYQQSLNRAKEELIRLQRELEDNNKYLDEARNSFDKTSRSIDGFGNAVKDADDGKGKGLIGLVGSLGNLKSILVGGAVVTGAKELGEALFEIVDGTKEYRQIMGGLEASGEAAGYTAEQTAEAYRQLYGVLGDTQTAATTVANLQAIGLEQDDLTKIIEQTIGAWALYGDSIPIDGLAEAINETIKAGQVTGTLADVLNWGSQEGETFGLMLKDNVEFIELSDKELEKLTESQRAQYDATKAQYDATEDFNEKLADCNSAEDYFNLALKECSDNTERANLVMQAMAKQGLNDVAEGYRDVNSDIVDANESQMKWDESVAKLGETLSPAADALRSFGADAIVWVTERIQEAVGWIQDLIEWSGNLNNSLNSRTENRMASYGYTKVDMPDGSYRWIDTSAASDLATANTQESPAATAMDMRRAMSQAVSYGVSAGSKGVERIEVVAEIDGREVGRAVHEYVRDEGKANPEVESDTL